MNLPRSRRCPLVIALLSITIAARTSASTEPAFDQRTPPFWQFVLREFVFKTLSTPRHRHDDDLYRKLLEAPFYGDRSTEAAAAAAAASGDFEAVISRGNVYNTPDGQWILCQDGCTRCEPCEWRRVEPAVMWTLRRVRRWTSPGTPKWDLRLTVVPKMDERRSRERYDRAYATRRDRVADSQNAGDSVPATSKQNYAFQKARRSNFPSPNGAIGYSHSDQPNVGIDVGHGNYRRVTGRVKRYRSRRRLTSDSYGPNENARDLKSSMELPEDDMNPRLIVGIDQNGKKHLVHLVPVDSPLSVLDEPVYATSYRPTYKRQHFARISRNIQERDASLYEKLIERIVDSFDTHRNFVEKFLYSDRLESAKRSESPALSPYSSYPGYPESEGADYDGRNLEGYRVDDSRQVNQYPSGTEYQVAEGEEEGEELRRYPDLTRGVNKPYGEYQDQNTMIEYEPYGVSAEGQEHQQPPQQQQHQQQHQNERFLTLADVERKRRNSFAKLMDPTVGHQALNQNHTQTDASDTEFPTKRDVPENSTNQALANFQPKINVTDTRMTR